MHARRARPSCVTQPGRDADSQQDVDLVLELETPFTFYNVSTKKLTRHSVIFYVMIIFINICKTSSDHHGLYLHHARSIDTSKIYMKNNFPAHQRTKRCPEIVGNCKRKWIRRFERSGWSKGLYERYLGLLHAGNVSSYTTVFIL